jgi:hypothetical protein
MNSIDLPQMDQWVATYVHTAKAQTIDFDRLTRVVDIEQLELSSAPIDAPQQLFLSTQTTAILQNEGLALGGLPEALQNVWDWSKQALIVYSEVKDFVAQFTNIGDRIQEFVLNASQAEDNTPTILVLKYLLKGQCTDRLGREIKKPSNGNEENYFQVALDIGKILLQRKFDEQFHLPWLAAPTDDLGKTHRFWALQVSELSKPLIGAGVSAGLAVIPTGLAVIPGLSEDGKKAVSMVAGVTFSKPIEYVIYRTIDTSPERWIELTKKIGGIE